MISNLEKTLKKHGLGKYYYTFRANNKNDIASVERLNDIDLEQMGIKTKEDREKIIIIFKDAKKHIANRRHLIITLGITIIVLLAFSFYYFYPKLLYKNGLKLFEENDYDGAIIQYSKVIKIRNIDSVYYMRALAYLKTGNKVEAIKDLSKHIEYFPADDNAIYKRGKIYLDLNQYDNAINDLSKHIEHFPADDNAIYERGKIYFDLHQYVNAIADLSKYIEHFPADDNAIYERGIAHMALHQYDSAIVDFINVININEKKEEAYFYLGQIYSNRKEYKTAIIQFGKVLELTPSNEDALIERAYAFSQIKEFGKALADYESALLINPNNKHIYYEEGIIYFSQGKKDKATSTFNKGLLIPPVTAYDYYYDGCALFAMKEFEKSIDSLTKAISKGINIADAYFKRGKANNNLKNYLAANKDYEKVISLCPNEVDAYLLLANNYYELENYFKAAEYYEGAENVSSNAFGLDLRYKRAYSYLKAGVYSKAIKDFTILADKEYKNKKIFYWLACAHLSFDNNDEAINNYTKSIKNGINKADSYFYRAVAYYRLDRIYETLADLKESLSLKPSNHEAVELRNKITRHPIPVYHLSAASFYAESQKEKYRGKYIVLDGSVNKKGNGLLAGGGAGAVIGGLLFGPLGAVIGLGVGVDKGDKDYAILDGVYCYFPKTSNDYASISESDYVSIEGRCSGSSLEGCFVPEPKMTFSFNW